MEIKNKNYNLVYRSDKYFIISIDDLYSIYEVNAADDDGFYYEDISKDNLLTKLNKDLMFWQLSVKEIENIELEAYKRQKLKEFAEIIKEYEAMIDSVLNSK